MARGSRSVWLWFGPATPRLPHADGGLRADAAKKGEIGQQVERHHPVALLAHRRILGHALGADVKAAVLGLHRARVQIIAAEGCFWQNKVRPPGKGMAV